MQLKSHSCLGRVLVCDSIHDEGIRILEDSGFKVDFKPLIKAEELISEVSKYDALVVRSRTRVTKPILEAGENLKVVARAGVGLDNIDVEAATKRGIIVINSPEAPSNAVAELVIGLMLSLARKIPEADASVKQGEWIKNRLTGFELKNKILGIIGFGKIGYLVAKKAKAFDMRVLIHDVIIEELMNQVREVGGEAVSFEEVLSISDFVTLHIPLTPDTRYLIGEKEFGKMKGSAYLINTSRGAIVDEAALVKALKAGKIAGAALDVYEEEPPKRKELTELKNVICTPHIGAETVEAQRANSVIVAEKLIKLFKKG
ncbi:hydroxyacid dehydrogenase [Candidatus Bathyarchaeota archaeon]|nr:hydroxyacid dehydrogenase [Candidatus Bathyarchaeota archaeon]MBS7630550.1 hydroxyacid dehydrogenase [Candidatus Bathyarchaeota archaeon]